MKRVELFLLINALLLVTRGLSAEVLTMTASDWAMPRSGEAMIGQPAMSQAAQALVNNAESRLLIRYPGGDEGSLWASEVRAWFVALGIASSQIEMQPGVTAIDQIELEIIGSSNN